ncbi:unnamed protein product, partial [Didymodactylos carnosus]
KTPTTTNNLQSSPRITQAMNLLNEVMALTTIPANTNDVSLVNDGDIRHDIGLTEIKDNDSGYVQQQTTTQVLNQFDSPSEVELR